MYFVWNIIMAYMVSTMTNSEPMKNGYGFVQEWVMPDNGNVTIKSVDQTSIFRETQVEGGRLCLFTLLEIRCIWIYIYIYTLTLRYPSFLGSFQNRLFFGVVPFFLGSFAQKRSFPLSYVNLQPQPSRLKEPSKALRLSFSCGSLSAPGSGMGSRSPILICMHKESFY